MPFFLAPAVTVCLLYRMSCARVPAYPLCYLPTQQPQHLRLPPPPPFPLECIPIAQSSFRKFDPINLCGICAPSSPPTHPPGAQEMLTEEGQVGSAASQQVASLSSAGFAAGLGSFLKQTPSSPPSPSLLPSAPASAVNRRPSVGQVGGWVGLSNVWCACMCVCILFVQ